MAIKLPSPTLQTFQKLTIYCKSCLLGRSGTAVNEGKVFFSPKKSLHTMGTKVTLAYRNENMKILQK